MAAFMAKFSYVHVRACVRVCACACVRVCACARVCVCDYYIY